MCASIWAGVQYMLVNDGVLSTCPFSRISSARSNPPAPASLRYGSGSGSWAGGATRAADSADSGTIHGDTEVANDLPRNGPSGTDSQACRSLDDQSLTRKTPN